MLIDVKELSVGGQKSFAFDSKITVDGVPVSVQTDGKVTLTKEGYVLSGNFKAVLDLKCDLCLEAFTQDAEGTLDEVFSNNADADKGYWGYEDKTLDIGPMLKANIMLVMPMKAVCSENCRGLCPVCGQNLNKGECGCDRGYINPAFDGLMDLFK
ncbi:MAG: DUF177 domain-containing protein [Firmicutes bacterium]|nr:DUF177 domain-containing protein [Bacillota bacterium]